MARRARVLSQLGGQVVRQAVELFADGQGPVQISEKGHNSHQAASIRAATDDFPERLSCRDPGMRVSLGNEKPFASTSVEAVKIRQRRPFPWPGRAPLLILKLPRIPGHGTGCRAGSETSHAARCRPLGLAGVIKTLQVRWGYCMTEKLEVARGMIREAAMWCPGLTNYLNVTGLGSDPWLIQKLAERRRR